MRNEEIESLLAPALEGMGLELVGAESSGAARTPSLRIYIDKVPGGVNIDDLTRATYQVRDTLRVAGFPVDDATLEVSSPGLERPLMKLSHFERFIGSRVTIQLHVPLNGQRKLTGNLSAVEGETIVLATEAETLNIPFSDIAKAKLSPERP